MQDVEAVLGAQLLHPRERLAHVRAVEDDRGAVARGRLGLGARRVRGHHHGHRDAGRGTRVGHGLGVVAGRDGHDASSALLRAELEDAVGGAARLEGSR